MNMSETVTMEQVTLERFPIAVRKALADFPLAMTNAEMSSQVDYATAKLCYELRSWLIGKRHEVEVRQIPTTWWQHYKQRWFPAWARKRWPVQTERLVVSETHLCPHATVKWPDTQHIEFMVQR